MGEQVQRGITLIITSCGRPDLLIKTLDSFYIHAGIFPTIIYEDSGVSGINYEIKNKYPDIIFIEPEKRTGQIVAQDCLWKSVKTKYVLSWEDDWETYKPDFIEPALEILEKYDNIIQVLFRHPSDNNNHPSVTGGIGYRYLSTNYHWKGFSFSPSLKRLIDYKKIGSYGEHTSFNKKNPWLSEKKIGELYFSMGYKAAILKGGYVRHIGNKRHVI